MKTTLALAASIIALALSQSASAEHIVDITGAGAQKFSVQINVGNQAFARSLARNLELSGLFKVSPGGSIRVVGAPGAIRAEGRGKAREKGRGGQNQAHEGASGPGSHRDASRQLICGDLRIPAGLS